MSHFNLSHAADHDLVSAADRVGVLKELDSDIRLTGQLVVQHFRGGKRINEYHLANGIVNEGKNRLLNVMFHEGTQISTWYLGLIDNSGYSALADDDTYDDVDQAGNGWDEFKNYTTGGSGTNRPEWQEDAASGQAITNSTVAIYDITGSGTVKGLFLCGGGATCNTKGDHDPAGTLWATALFGSGDVAVQNGDQLKVTYTVSA